MQGVTEEDRAARTPLSRERVVRTAVAVADAHGVDAVSMRRVAHELGVDPMSLYNHVANKEDLLDGMANLVVAEIDLTPAGDEWKPALRARVLEAREMLSRHPWAAQVIETRSTAAPAILQYFEAALGILRDGGFSLDLAHHSLHALGSRLLGFSQELFDDSGAFADPEVAALQARQMAGDFPNLSAMMLKISHDEATVVGSGCDDRVEFLFALDLVLDGLERLRNA
jgi:AcrR family transcriptional regulator